MKLGIIVNCMGYDANVVTSVDAVLTKRDKSGMSKFRTLLEEFESLLISSKYSNQKNQRWSMRLLVYQIGSR